MPTICDDAYHHLSVPVLVVEARPSWQMPPATAYVCKRSPPPHHQVQACSGADLWDVLQAPYPETGCPGSSTASTGPTPSLSAPVQGSGLLPSRKEPRTGGERDRHAQLPSRPACHARAAGAEPNAPTNGSTCEAKNMMGPRACRERLPTPVGARPPLSVVNGRPDAALGASFSLMMVALGVVRLLSVGWPVSTA